MLNRKVVCEKCGESYPPGWPHECSKDNSNDPVCGNCGKPLSEHYHEHEIFCFLDTTGDIFRDEPREDVILNQLADMFPEEYDKLVEKWKIENGHMQR